jgi:MFS family permease
MNNIKKPMKTFNALTPLAIFICLLAALFYMYEFALQVSMGVMTNQLMQELGLNAAGVGLASAFYYYAYTPMQIPAGLLFDRFGPRRTMTAAIIICALGACCFSLSKGLIDAALGRFLMGIGSAFSFSGALLLIVRWFPPQYFAILAGIVQLMSCIGAIGGEIPLALAVDDFGWRHSMKLLALFGLILAFLVWLIVRDYPRDHPPPHDDNHLVEVNLFAKIKLLLGNASAWWIAAYSFLIWAPIATFAGLWGIPFIVSAYHIDTESASIACAAIWVGIGIGCPLLGWISEKISRRIIVIASCAIIGIIASLLVLYIHLSIPMLYLALFAFGIAGSGQSLAFCIVRDNSHPFSIGAAIGLNNMATVAGGAILQPIIGYILYLHWNGVLDHHIPVYSAENYRVGLIIIPICYALAWLISIKCISETFCKQKFLY